METPGVSGVLVLMASVGRHGPPFRADNRDGVPGGTDPMGGRYGGLPIGDRLASIAVVAAVLTALGWLLLSAGRVAVRRPAEQASLRLFLIRPPPPPPPVHSRIVRPLPPRPRPGGASPRRHPLPPPAPDPVIAAPAPVALALAAPADLTAAPAALTGLDGSGGAGAGTGQGAGAGDGAGGPPAILFARAEWVRRPDRAALARYWPKRMLPPRREVRLLLACRVDPELRPFGCTVVAGRWLDPAYGRAAIAMLGEALIRPVTRDGRRTDLPVLVPVTFLP